MVPTATLKNWRYFNQHGFMIGDVYNHIKKTWPDGTHIHTSHVHKVYRFPDHLIVICLDAIYKVHVNEGRGL